MSNIGNKEIFAENLAYYVDKSGKSQKELAGIAGVATSTFNDWMKAKKYPRIDKIEILANHFRIMKSDLIEDKKEMQKNNDIAADIVDKLLDKPSIYPLLERLLDDAQFLSLVESLNNLDDKKIQGVSQMLNSFQ